MAASIQLAEHDNEDLIALIAADMHDNASPEFPVLRKSRSILVGRYSDWGDETVAASGNVDDEAIPILTVTQCATQR